MISQWKSFGFEQIKCPSAVVPEGLFGVWGLLGFVGLSPVVPAGVPVEPPVWDPPPGAFPVVTVVVTWSEELEDPLQVPPP